MHFILGNFGSGKTSLVKKEVLSLLQQNKQVLLIVPSRRHKDQLLLELLKQQKGIIGNPVLTLVEFQKKLIQQIFANNQSISLSNFEKFLVISSIVTKNSNKFKAFKNINNRPELLKMVYRLVHSLREKDIEQLTSSPELQDKIYDLQLILSEYHQYLISNNIADPKQEIDLICNSNLDLDFIPNDVYIDGFVDFTATQFKLIQHIATQNNHKNITITLTDAPHSITKNTISHFKESFPQATITTLDNKPSIADAFLLEKDFTQTDLEFNEIQAFGKSKEIEYIINQIKKLCLTQDYSLEDILLVTNRQDQYSPILVSALRKADIPFAFGKDDKLSQNPLIMFIKRLLKLSTENLTHESLEFLAQSNYVKQEYQQSWSTIISSIPFAVDGKQHAWEQAFGKLDEEDLQELDKDSIINLCEKLYAIDQYKPYPISTIIQYVVDLIDFLGVQEELTKTIPLIKHKKIIELSIAKDYSALLKLKEIILELQKSLESMGELSLNNFLFFFNMIAEETRYRSEIPQKNILRILTPNDTRGLFAKAVFVLGLNENEFPSSPRLELFDNFDRSQLNSLSKKILGQSLWETEVDYFNEQKLAFATVLSRAKNKMFFSRTPVNEKGVYFNCSHFLQRILDKNISYVRIPYTDSNHSENPAIFNKKHLAEEYFELSQLTFLSSTKNSSKVQDAYLYTKNIEKANDIFDKEQIPNDELCEYFGYIKNVDYVTKKYNSSTIPISPTRLEKLGRCRYRGLWQDFWKLKSYSLPSYKPEAADYGNLYHNVLELYIPKESEFDPDLLHQILQDCIENSTQSYLFTLDYHFIYLTLSGFLQNIQPLLSSKTKFVEMSSGEGELSHNVIALSPQQSLTVYSRVDRVDFDNNTYSVIDYKKSGDTSYKEYQKTPFNLFQGFLYSELLRNNNIAPIQSVSYVFLEKQTIFEEFPNTSSKISYQSIHEFQDFKLTEINRLISLLKEGNFSPFTLESDIGVEVKTLFEEKFGEKFPRENQLKCSYCDLQKLCLRRQKKIRTF